jgi:hypothetical protein
MAVDQISRHYIELAFAIERHMEGYIDGYYGPAELKEQAAAQPDQSLDAIADGLGLLRTALQASDYPTRRKQYLGVQIRGMQTMVRKLAGDQISYRDEVRDYFDIEPTQTPDDLFAEAIEQLDELLPGEGSIADRMRDWNRRFEVSPKVAQNLIDIIAQEARKRTLALLDLPGDESVSFSLVNDKPWSGYNWYLGGHKSLVEINTDLPIRANRLLGLICHEAYPGHHTEHSLKEFELYEQKGWGEHSILLINTPECVISEGIATLAEEIIFEHDYNEWLAREIFPVAQIEVDVSLIQRINAAARPMAALNSNAALLLHEQGGDPEEVVQYIMRYGLRTEKEARQSLRFISDPLWRPYVFTYHAGYALLSRWLKRGDRKERFVTLLRDQIYPSLVETWAIEEERNCVRG